MDDEEDENSGSGLDLTGFLFGNINEKGELEDSDILDEESCRQLGHLGAFGPFGQMVQDIDGPTDSKDEGEIDSHSIPTSRVDYTNIDEAIEDVDDTPSVHRGASTRFLVPKIHTEDDDDYDDDDEEEEGDSSSRVAPSRPSPSPSPPRSSDSPPAWTDENKEELYAYVMKHFPEFAPNKVLRFSRLFGAAKSLSRPEIWASAAKRRRARHGDGDDDDDVTATTTEPKCWRIDEDGEKEFFLSSPPALPPEMFAPGNETKFHQCLDETKRRDDHSTSGGDRSGDVTMRGSGPGKENHWRHGPAKLIYDLAGIPEDATELDYGLKLKPNVANGEADAAAGVLGKEPRVSDENFLMVNQVRWEDDIIWSPDQLQSVQQREIIFPTSALSSSLVQLSPAAPGQPARVAVVSFSGGLNSPITKTAPTTLTMAKFPTNMMIRSQGIVQSVATPTTPIAPTTHLGTSTRSSDPSDNYSIFPIENEDLIYGNWEDDVIFDVDNLTKVPSPTRMKLDPNDDDLLLGLPYDPEPEDSSSQQTPAKKERKSRILLGKAGIIKMEQNEASETVEKRKDPFNFSCDEYYKPKQDTSNVGLKIGLEKNVIQHSIPAMELYRDWFPTHLTAYQMRHFHRLPLKAQKKVANTFIPVNSLSAHIENVALERERERAASGGGDVFFMRRPNDLSAMDGEVLLMEYCEEHPPHIMATGMATKLVNYYKRKPKNDSGAPKAEFGETIYVQKSPFLGQISPGKLLFSLECNLFRAPIFRHVIPETDFLVIMLGNRFYIRNATALFAVGQQCPKFEVPGPKSKKTSNHVKDFLQGFIYRLFLASEDDPKRIRMEDIRRAFPHLSESSIRKRLKGCADFNRTGSDSGWWRLKDNFRLPSEEELRAMVSPEQCCAFYSMLAAKQRLEDAGYGGKSLFTPDDDMEEDSQKIDDEVRTAPWNTTRHFINAAQGKCLLDVNGPADPTGCGEGFSYIRIPNKPMAGKEEATEKKKQKTVTGTDADLRKLLLKDGRDVLRRFNVPEEEIQKLSRWEVVDVVRAMSTQAAKQGEGATSRFARGNRFSIAEHQERYKDECQRIFDLQNTVLSSDAVLSTDEGSSSEEDDEYDKLEKDLESLIMSKKTKSQYTYEQEEEERKALKKRIEEDSGTKSSQENPTRDDDDVNSVGSFDSSAVAGSRRLVIYRTFRQDGREYVRREVVKKPSVIDAYVKIASNKDRNLKAQFASQDDQHREEMKKERRRIQEQLRRLKRSKEREKAKPQKPKKEKIKPELQLKCGACGQKGHMKTNKNCPKYNKSGAALAPPAAVAASAAAAAAAAGPASAVTPTTDATAAGGGGGASAAQPARAVTTPIIVAMTEEQQAAEESVLTKNDFQVRVEGTKISLNRAFVDHAEDVRRRSLLLRVPRHAVKKKPRGQDHCDYLQKRHKSAQRRKTSSELELSKIFEQILTKMKQVHESHPFHAPVPVKIAPDYYDIINRPMDLQKIRENIREKVYKNRNQFVEHVRLILSNCQIYNGQQDPLSKKAQEIVDVCIREMEKNEEKITELEKEINPLLGDDPQMAFSFLLDRVIDRMKSVPESAAFHQPVNRKQVADYYDVVKEPMDLETLRLHVHDFRTREEFMEQAQLIESNCVLYNGPDVPLTQVSRRILTVCREALASLDEQLTSLEEEIVMLPDEADSLVDDSRSRPESVDRDESSMHSKGDTPLGGAVGIVPHPLSLSDDASLGSSMMPGDLMGFGQPAPDFRSSLLMQDLEASDDDDEEEEEDEYARQRLAPPVRNAEVSDDERDIDFEPDADVDE